MKRIATIIAAVVAIVGLGFAGAAGYAATTKPVYVKPGTPTIAFTEYNADTGLFNAEVVHTASPYADFYRVQVSLRSDFASGSIYEHYISPHPQANAHTIEGLQPATKYYFRVAVINSNDQRLSPYSGVRAFTTPAEAPAEE